jgi:mannose-6-phosphate isomerase-like protein (cupin superfamily)
MIKTRYREVPAYTTKDGSEIRELIHPDVHGNHHQSLAEATIPPGQTTRLHKHNHSEELYHITSGHGLMRLGEEVFEVRIGDTVVIPPGSPHAVENFGDEPLVILCCCAPPYSHDDTQLL